MNDSSPNTQARPQRLRWVSALQLVLGSVLLAACCVAISHAAFSQSEPPALDQVGVQVGESLVLDEPRRDRSEGEAIICEPLERDDREAVGVGCGHTAVASSRDSAPGGALRDRPSGELGRGAASPRAPPVRASRTIC